MSREFAQTPMPSYAMADVNQLSESEFVQLLGAVFEETPVVAQRAWAARPFASVDALHRAMVAVVAEEMTRSEQIELIRAHPELGAKQKMAAASVGEQAGAGLNDTSDELYRRILDLNGRYREHFGFPFVMAVKGQTRESIVAALEERLENERENEVVRSLSEIYKIARFRIANIISDAA